MKKNMKTRLFSGLMALCMLLSLLPTAAFAAEVPEYNTPEYPETSEGVTVESSFDSEAQKVLTTIVIGENVEGDTLDINLTDALGEALNNSLAVPGDVAISSLKSKTIPISRMCTKTAAWCSARTIMSARRMQDIPTST